MTAKPTDDRYDTRLDNKYGYTRAPKKTIVLMVEAATVTPTGD